MVISVDRMSVFGTQLALPWTSCCNPKCPLKMQVLQSQMSPEKLLGDRPAVGGRKKNWRSSFWRNPCPHNPCVWIEFQRGTCSCYMAVSHTLWSHIVLCLSGRTSALNACSPSFHTHYLHVRDPEHFKTYDIWVPVCHSKLLICCHSFQKSRKWPLDRLFDHLQYDSG